MELKDRKLKLKDLLLDIEVKAAEGNPITAGTEDRFGYEQLLMIENAGLILIDEAKDTMTLTASGRALGGLRPEGVPDLGAVKLKEVTGNVDEQELSARYVEQKVAGVDTHIKADPNNQFLKVMSVILEETANELRIGMHLPDDKLPQYPGLGVELGDSLIRIADFFGVPLLKGKIVHPDNDPTEMEILVMMQKVVNVIEKFEQHRKRPMDQVQTAPSVDSVEFLPPADIAEMTDKKLAFNAQRADHKLENRVKDGGKKS